MKHVFILNAFAGKKSSVEQLTKKIHELKLTDEYVIEVTQAAGDAKIIANKHVSSTDDFVRV